MARIGYLQDTELAATIKEPMAEELDDTFQGLNDTLTDLSGREIGADNPTDILDRQSADIRYAAFGSGVLTFNTRTGAVTLLSADVTTALGYTPYNATNPSGYISGNQTITFSGDASGSGATSVTLTLATVNSNVGSFGSSTAIPVITVDGKGRITSVSTTTPAPPAATAWGTITGTLSSQTDLQNALNLKAPIASPVFTGTVGIGSPSTGLAKLHVSLDGTTPSSALYTSTESILATSNAANPVRLAGASATATVAPQFISTRAKGTLASPTTVANGDRLLSIVAQGYNGSTIGNGAQIVFEVDGTPVSGGRVPGTLYVITTADDGSGALKRWQWLNTGHYVPGLDNVYNIGSSSLRPKAVYAAELRGSAVYTNIRSVTTNYAIVADDHTVLGDATAGAMAVNLPAAASNSGRIIVVKKIDSSGNAVTIQANGSDTIDGAATKAISIQWSSFTIQCNGTGWFIL